MFIADQGGNKVYAFPANVDGEKVEKVSSRNLVGEVTNPFGVAVWSDVKILEKVPL